MGHTDAVGTVYIERLRQRRAGAASGWVTHMAYAHFTHQTHHMAATENIPGQPFAFALMQLTVLFGHYAGGILPSMLQHGQRVVEL